jgi:hypothetical protein
MLEQRLAEIIAKMKSNLGTHQLYIKWLEEALKASEREYN